MLATLAEIRVAYTATFNQRLPGDMAFVKAGQLVFEKLGSLATKRLINRIKLIFVHQPELSFEEMVAIAKDWELVKRGDTFTILTDTGSIVGEGKTKELALDDALDTIRQMASKKAN